MPHRLWDKAPSGTSGRGARSAVQRLTQATANAADRAAQPTSACSRHLSRQKDSARGTRSPSCIRSTKFEHVSPFACRQRLLILGEHIGYLFEHKAELVRVDELSDQRHVLGREAVIQPDEKAAQNASDLLVVDAIHTRDRLRPNVLNCSLARWVSACGQRAGRLREDPDRELR
jgi:hypothetical protein